MTIQSQFEIDGTWSSVEYSAGMVQTINNETDAVISIIGYSVEDRPLYALTIGDGPNKTLVTSGVHGTERASHEAILIKMRDVCYNVDGEYTDYLNSHQIMFIPTVNPDRMHRSYRNADNIDINRVIYHLDSPEGIAFLETYRDFKPDLFFDFHEHSGNVSADTTYVYAMLHDPNSDIFIRQMQGESIDAVRDNMEDRGYSTDYYYASGTGFGSLTSGINLLGTIAYTAETRTKEEDLDKRVEQQKLSLDSSLDWQRRNTEKINNLKQYFKDHQLTEGDTYILLQGMNHGAEMYLQATHEPIKLPYGYQLDDISAFQHFIDVYDMTVEEGNIIPVNQKSGRLLPHMLDPRSDLRKVDATPVYRGKEFEGGRVTKAKYADWQDVVFKNYVSQK